MIEYIYPNLFPRAFDSKNKFLQGNSRILKIEVSKDSYTPQYSMRIIYQLLLP